MAEPEKNSGRNCAQCGAVLHAGLESELCPKCLLQAALGTQPMGPDGTVVASPGPAKSRGLPQPGEHFGHYRIIRLLGEGGMGAAFEADDLDTGRRVALKVLSHKLDSPEARERFFREGRLAASINHPNSVYVFGTEEIAGTPVIAMELVSGGTLQNLLDTRGPLPVGQAVDAALQIITGLEAAQQIGILHRDIKPSNCFRDADGTVKIGDFGLSISTAIRTEPALTAPGAFLGTPAFCSPEQLRGDELNARSDMYSVGATLYYLLTGRMPFEGKNPVQLLATVLEQRPPSPRKFRPDIPKGLARIILRCLEKNPGDRFKSYDELREALAPYSSVAPTPATLGLRFVAGAIDTMLLSLLNFIIVIPLFGGPFQFLEEAQRGSRGAMLWMSTGFLLPLVYFTLLEGTRGASLGKALCRLRVTRLDRSPPGYARALVRATLFGVLPVLPYWIVFAGRPQLYPESSVTGQTLLGFTYYAVLALLFCTIRRRNGFAAVHDLVTKTRVVGRMAIVTRPVVATPEVSPASVENRATIGPFHVLESLEKTPEVEWLLGYDLRLLRKVWIRVVPPETLPVPAQLRNLGRIGRLRWLAGKRAAEENWDAFEAPAGVALPELLRQVQPWSKVRFWLYDLAQELSAAEKNGTIPDVLALNRVWITAEGRAKLLDFPAPGFSDSTHSDDEVATEPPVARAGKFLKEIANAAFCKKDSSFVPPLPLYARAFLEKLLQFADSESIARALQPLLHRVAEVSRKRRAAIVAGCLVFPLIAGCGMFFGTMMMLEKWNQRNPDIMEMQSLLQQRRMGIFARLPNGPTDKQLSVYLATRFRSTITNQVVWTSPLAVAMINDEERRFAERSVTENPAPSAEEIADAEKMFSTIKTYSGFSFGRQPWFPFAMLYSTLGIYVAVPALVAALLFRGGLVLLIAGVTFARRDGARASRWRVFWRAIVAWSPLLLCVILMLALRGSLGALGSALTATILFLLMAVISVAMPRRGLADRLAGTWPVPR